VIPSVKEDTSVSEYNIEFSEKLIDCAKLVKVDPIDVFEAKRTVVYLSKLSCEIILKALLEKAGKPIKEIRGHSHNLIKLLDELCWCQIKKDIRGGDLRWVSASDVRSKIVDKRYSDATIGHLLSGEKFGASKYPNIRYGDQFTDFPPELILKAAIVLLNWAKKYWDSIRVLKTHNEFLMNLGSK
jgi:hypothetical protein